MKESGKYGGDHLAFCAHYVGDLSQPLHNAEHNLLNLTYHKDVKGIIDDGLLGNPNKIKVYPIHIDPEGSLPGKLRTRQ